MLQYRNPPKEYPGNRVPPQHLPSDPVGLEMAESAAMPELNDRVVFGSTMPQSHGQTMIAATFAVTSIKPNKTCRCGGLEPLFVSRKDAAEALSISLRAVAYLIANGDLKTRKIGGRTLIPVDDLRRFARSDHRGPIVPSSPANLAQAA